MTQDAKTISDRLRADFPLDVFEFKSNKVYLPADVVIERLLDATDGQYSWTKISYEIRESDGVMKARNGGYIPKVMIFEGMLSIPGLGERYGCGVQELEENSGADSSYKGAEADAIKRAARGFGVGLKQLYLNPVKQGQTNERPQRSTQQHEPAPPSVQTQQMSSDEFREACIAGFVNKDSTRLKQLIAQAGDDPERWVLMVKSTQTVAQIDWVATAMEKQGVGVTPAYGEAAIARRKELEPSTN